MKSYCAKSEDVEKKWYVVDAEGRVLGRLASKVATVLRGKNKATFTPHVDTGDFVVVINAEKIKVTGSKETQKFYRRHSGFPGGFKEESLEHLRKRKPQDIVEKAVRGMLPHSRLGDRQFTKLKVCVGPNHPFSAQNPQALDLSKTK